MTDVKISQLPAVVTVNAATDVAPLVSGGDTTKATPAQIVTAALTATPVTVAQGGSGLTSTPSNGQLLIGNGTGYSLATLTAGSNVTITNSAGGITIEASGGGGGGFTFSLVGYTYTGPVDPVGLIVLSAPIASQNGGVISQGTGVDVKSISFVDFGATAIEFSNVRSINDNFNPSTMASLTTLSLPSLVTVGGSYQPSTMAALTTLSAPSLVGVGGAFNPSAMAALTTLSAPSLVSVGGNFTPNGMASLTTLSAPSLVSVGGIFAPNAMASLTTLSLPSLVSVGVTFQPNNMAALTTISIPLIESIDSGRASAGNSIQLTSGTGALSSFELPSTLKRVGGTAGNVTITSAALNQTSVDSILVSLAALDGTNGTTSFNGRTVTITGTSSTPSATGLAAKATLVARGCTVTHN